MSAPYDITPLNQIGGIDRRGTELTRPSSVAADCVNWDHMPFADEGTCRPGSKVIGDNAGAGGGFGTWMYSNAVLSGNTTERLIAGSKLFRQKTGSLAITYGGTGTSVTCSVLPVEVTRTYKFYLYVDGTEVLAQDLGVGFDETTPYTIDDLATAINSIANFSTTVIGCGDVPAAFLPITVEQQIGRFEVSPPPDPLVEDTFETGTKATWWEAGGVDTTMYSPNTAETAFNTDLAHSGSYSANYFAQAGTNEKEPIKLSLTWAELATIFGAEPYEIYVEWWEYYVSGYPWPATSQKLCRFGYFDINEPGTPVGDNSENWFTDHVIHTANDHIQTVLFAAGGGEYSYNSASGVDEDTWIKWGIHIKCSSVAGASDGIYQLYKNDVAYLGASGLNFGPTRRPINSIWIGGNYSNGGNLASSGNRRIDDIKIYSTLPTSSIITLTSNPLYVRYNEQVGQPTGAPDPFVGLAAVRNTSAFTPVSSIEKDNCRYFTTGYDYLQKYDGAFIYRAGCPAGTLTSVTPAGGSVAAGTYLHAVTIAQQDAQGNYIEGEISASRPTTVGVSSQFSLVIPTIQNTSGFLTDAALVNGAQTGVTTITVTAGHSLKIGQTAYFYDGVSAAYVTRTITNTGATSITISGAAVNVTAGLCISANLRLVVWRTLAGGTILRKVVELPNNPFVSSITYVDNNTDASLGSAAQYDYPADIAAPHTLAPKFKYLAIFKSSVIGLNIEGRAYSFQFSDVDSGEYWPPINQVDIQGGLNQNITGGVQNADTFLVFKKQETHEVVGDLFAGQYDVSLKSSSIGCVAHASIVKFDSGIAWAGANTFYYSEAGAFPADVGLPVSPFFNSNPIPELSLQWDRCVSAYDATNSKVLWFIPAETTTGGNVWCNTNSYVLAFDIFRKLWKPFKGLNMGGGVCYDGNTVWWVEKRYATFDSTMKFAVWEHLQTGTVYDCIDHLTNIEGEYIAGWEFLGRPSVLKDFVTLRAYSVSPKSASFDLRVQTEVNFVPDVAHSDVTLTFGDSNSMGGGFSYTSYGIDPHGDPVSNQIQEMKLLANSVRAFRPRFSFSVFCEQPILSGWELEVTTPYKVTMNK